RAAPPGTAVVVASDHGEALGEHLEATHGTLCYGATADVFLAARGPGLTPGAVDGDARSLCDVAPTARAWFGLPQPGSDGSPLTRRARSRVLLTESLLAWGRHGWGQCFAATDGRFTLVETGPRVELFDREADAGELRPLDLRGHEAYERLDRALQDLRAGKSASWAGMLDSASPYGAARRPVSDYLPREENARLVDPSTRFDYNARIADARQAAYFAFVRKDRAMLESIVARLESLAREEVSSPSAPHYLAWARGRLAELVGEPSAHAAAARAAKEALDRGYLVAPVLYLLLSESLAAGDAAAMRAALDAAADPRIGIDLACLGAAVEICTAIGDAEA
ncbi:MAG: hypothetical protein ACREID_08055, partial [Planctomycetota bacterium]